MNREITGYFRTVNEVFPLNIRPYDFTVLQYLSKCANKDRECFPSIIDIATQCNMSKSQVKLSIKVLKAKNYITHTLPGHTGKNTHYILSKTLFEYPETTRLPRNPTRSATNPH